MATIWKDHWPQCQLQQFVTLASWILFLVLLHTSYLHSTSPSSGSMRSETSAFELQEKGHSRKIITAAARHILSTEHQANISLKVETGEVLPPATATTGLKQNVLTRIVISKPCENVRDHTGFASACAYVQANTDCHSGTLVDYTVIFYCRFAKMQLVGYLLLFIWLGMLFYMLGNTAADYFCCSLEKLTNLLRLPPTVAGVSLLPLGNGAPDVFASIAAFLRSGHSQVGLNSVLGGALFVTSVVAGSVSLAVQLYSQERSRVRIDFCCFLRDMGFFFFTLGILCAIIVAGEINFWKSVAYASIYVVYGISWNWRQHAHVAIYSHASLAGSLDLSLAAMETNPRPLWGYAEQLVELQVRFSAGCLCVQAQSCWRLCLRILELPFDLPRRLTIPVIEDDRWSRPLGIASAVLAPVLLAGVWDSKDGEPFGTSITEYLFGGSVGVVLGILAFFTTESERPPHNRWLFIWVAGGFVMSIVWFYLIATELVAALVALGVILEIDSAFLGLTLLAWGNSIGDLMSNLAISLNSGDGVQIAISGCYAGPMFNTLAGLGLSFMLATWKTFPNVLVLRHDNSLFYTIGFLFLSLLWALLVLPASGMSPNKILGAGLLLLYTTFLLLQLASLLGLISFGGVGLDSNSGFLGIQIL
ncbi:unnamed protein product [Sphagnum balticum]